MIKSPATVLDSGRVRRWHMNPAMARCGETNAEHQWCVVTILLAIHPAATRGQIIAALYHDVGELFAGDLSLPMKRAYPELAEQHRAIEEAERAEMVYCDDWDDPVVKVADHLAALVRMHQEGVFVDKNEWSRISFAVSHNGVPGRAVGLGKALGIL